MRPPGTASIEEHPKGSGKYRVRARIDGRLRTIRSNLSEGEATEIANAYAVVRDESVVREGITLDQFGQGALDRRERRDVRGIKQERARWRVYVSSSSLGRMAISAIRRKHVIDWRDGLKRKGSRSPLAYQTKTNALNLLRSVLSDAVDREVIQANPALEVRVPRGEDRKTEEDLAGVLRPEEQLRLVDAMPPESRPVVLFSLLTGLRLSEQWWLKKTDIEGGVLIVRRSVGGKSTKGRRVRRVKLPEPALEILASLPKTSSPWVFPGPRGGRRQYGKRPLGWKQALEACKFGRRIRWHDLRHTCATSLLAGWWGRKWTLEEVRGYLGHSSITVTERYARILDESVDAAIDQTFPGRSQAPLLESAPSAVFAWSRSPDLNRRPTVYESAECASDSGLVDGSAFPGGNMSLRGDISRLALAYAADRMGVLPEGRAA